MRNDKHSEDVLFESAVKTTIQRLYDERLFENYDNADEVIKDYLLIQVNKRQRPDINPTNHAENVL